MRPLGRSTVDSLEGLHTLDAGQRRMHRELVAETKAVLSRRASCGECRSADAILPRIIRTETDNLAEATPDIQADQRHPSKVPSSGSDSMRLRACSGVKGSRRSSPVAAGASVAALSDLTRGVRLQLALGTAYSKTVCSAGQVLLHDAQAEGLVASLLFFRFNSRLERPAHGLGVSLLPADRRRWPR